ncbi:nucleoside/nucleotide kinase family protein [Citrobacter sp. CK184]|uniref:nucleoside/nucleotide kinase family protein n=1 Tax=Citrobacter TaxID=544 RepID=UPI000536544D|nr:MULTISPECIES: nucleoside/nucleotide kinase family protein [Citrobacter]AVE58343.1 nucleoside/nucleotide kinase family protein [Citrobacter koseri]AYY74137.1 nucleoside/nucleotide kinase family protein [Citrobacter koseri]EKX8766696.1 nucleoside/nucleotide kinase family protein [Citrobacter koseri]ELJ2664553.1 nucleoside/nucleotide kinase family protein [Citrobacter koseri]ELO4692262.1 nucleoside/nucleotide kinase family protein [Citrobacter koseri]
MKISLQINGLMTDAWYDDDEVENVHKPLLRHLATLNAKTPERRTVIFLSAPPGTGKSTLTTFWEYLSRNDPELPTIQTLPMDGFHHYNRWLDEHELRAAKGAPETFNVEKLASNLRQLHEQNATWPQYDRQLHDPVENAIQVTAPVVIIEGNWLLYNAPSWRELRQYCDYSLFIRAPADVLRGRLIARKQAGGLSEEQAQIFFDRTDGPNVCRVLENSLPASLTLEMTAKGEYRLAQALPDEPQ